MVKFFGALLIIIACGGAGFFKGQKFAKRPVQIRKLRSVLQNLETEISWTATPLPEALNKVGKIAGAPVGLLFIKASDLIRENAYFSVGEAWEHALQKTKQYLAVGQEELEILKSFGYGLGNSHREEQIKNLSLVREHLKSLEITAEAEKVKYEKMYRTMGFLVGMAIALILI